MNEMKCTLGSDKVCELKELFTAMELRQKSFEARQSKTETNLANTDKNVAIIQRELVKTNTEVKEMTEKVNINTQQLTHIRDDIRPILDLINDIHYGIKPWLWLSRKMKWIATTILAGWVLFMDGVEHLMNFIKQ